MITDFNTAKDTILFEAGANTAVIEQRGADLFIQLAGGTDSILVLKVDRGVVTNFEFSSDVF